MHWVHPTDGAGDVVAARKKLLGHVTAKAAVHAGDQPCALCHLRSLLSDAMASGAIRPDTDAEDVLRALQGVWQVTTETDWQDKARRLLNLLMDGLRYGAPGKPRRAR